MGEPRRVLVKVPSHIHMGNPDLSGDYGRLYGTLGMVLEDPHVLIEAMPGEGCECSRRDVIEAYTKISRELECTAKIRVAREIPGHVGLGSTTALYLGMARAITLMCGHTWFDPVRWALKLGRGTVSALGVYTFIYGGLVFDAGFRLERKGREVPPILFRAEPPAWMRIIIALPRRPLPSILAIKEREEEILDHMPRMDPSFADRVSRMLLMGILGNAASGDWQEAGRYITMFNRVLGEYWGKEQGGTYCCDESSKLIDEMLASGAIFAGQSSWGPTVYGAFHEETVEKAVNHVKRVLDDVGGGALWVTRPSIRGAEVMLEW